MARLISFPLAFSLALIALVAVSSCKKSAAPGAHPRACTSDSDCEISCDHVGDCCHFPYCESAQHKDDAKDAREANQKSCTPDDQKKCPQIGSRMEPNYRVVVQCKSSACVAEKIPR